MTAIYVFSLYLLPASIRRRPRDDPVHIRARFASVGTACLLALRCVLCRVWRDGGNWDWAAPPSVLLVAGGWCVSMYNPILRAYHINMTIRKKTNKQDLPPLPPPAGLAFPSAGGPTRAVLAGALRCGRQNPDDHTDWCVPSMPIGNERTDRPPKVKSLPNTPPQQNKPPTVGAWARQPGRMCLPLLSAVLLFLGPLCVTATGTERRMICLEGSFITMTGTRKRYQSFKKGQSMQAPHYIIPSTRTHARRHRDVHGQVV